MATSKLVLCFSHTIRSDGQKNVFEKQEIKQAEALFTGGNKRPCELKTYSYGRITSSTGNAGAH